MLKKTIEGDTLRFADGEKNVLVMESAAEDGTVTVTLTGELRGELAHELRDELTVYAVIGWNLILDLKQVSYMASSVQNALFDIHKAFSASGRGSLVLKDLSDTVRRALESTGMLGLFYVK